MKIPTKKELLEKRISEVVKRSELLTANFNKCLATAKKNYPSEPAIELFAVQAWATKEIAKLQLSLEELVRAL